MAFTSQIILGEENRRTVLKLGPTGEVLASNDTFEVLACDEYRAFWLTWDNQTYEVRTFCHYQFQTYLLFDLISKQ